MSYRDTGSGSVLEQMVMPALERGGYSCATQARVGERPNGRRHIVDVLARKDGVAILVSLKWQEVSGTAEHKIPFELMCLADAVRAGYGVRGVIVLGGDGWTLRDYYTSGKLGEHLVYASLVEVLKLETFIKRVNRALL